uniref:hypothetical protein n=1 Tax=Klebsiella pneumoniae TaxID=573 RepID=UPI001D0DE092
MEHAPPRAEHSPQQDGSETTGANGWSRQDTGRPDAAGTERGKAGPGRKPAPEKRRPLAEHLDRRG